MCGVVDDILPIAGAVIGSVIPGLGTALGAAIGGAIGGGVKGWVQNHNLSGVLENGAIGGVGGYLGVGGGMGELAGGLGAQGASGAFDTSLASSLPESSFGMTAPAGFTGAELGTEGASTGLGTGLSAGSSLSGITAPGAMGGDVLSGISGNAGSLGSLSGNGSGGTDYSLTGGNSAGSGAGGTLNDVMSGNSGGFGTGISAGSNPAGLTASPTSTLSGLNPSTSTGVLGNSAPTIPGGASVLDGSQAVPMGGGSTGSLNLGDGGYSLEGGQGGAGLGNSAAAAQGGFGAPESTGLQATQGSPNIGAMGSDSGGGFGTGLTGQGHIGLTAPGGATGAAKMGTNGFGDFMNNYGSPLMTLFKTGLGAYQQHARQNALDNYRSQIDQEFSPNSPYAQQMAESLARNDAAAGRNSQYGTRSVQLAAALAQAHARALEGNNYFNAATATPGANILNSLFSNFSTPQGMQQLGKLYNLGSAGFNGLASLFGG